MQRAVNVQLAFLSALVVLATSLLTADEQTTIQQELLSEEVEQLNQRVQALDVDSRRLHSLEDQTAGIRGHDTAIPGLVRAAQVHESEAGQAASPLTSLWAMQLSVTDIIEKAHTDVIRKHMVSMADSLLLRVPEAKKTSTYIVRGFFTALVWALLLFLIGSFYYHEKQHPPRLDPEGVNVSLHDRERLDRQRWRFGLFDCMEVPSLCFFSCCCGPIRWADTMRMAGFSSFFASLLLVIGLMVLGFMTLGVGFAVLIAVCAHFRGRLRNMYKVRGSLTSDLLAFAFCPCCAIVQEARQIEEAYLARHASVWEQYMVKRSLCSWRGPYSSDVKAPLAII